MSAFSNLSALVISEVCANNENVITNEQGNESDWLELYNTDSATVSLHGLFLSDDRSNLKKHLITSNSLLLKPNSFALLWADGKFEHGSNHLNFKISVGETVYISSMNDGIIDSVRIIHAKADHSYGRIEYTTHSHWHYFTEPTPSRVNSSQAYFGYATPPEIDKSTGYYSDSISIGISADSLAYTYYTINNFDPNPDSSYTQNYLNNSINIHQTTVLRAKCYKTGYIPSETLSRLYVINEYNHLPVWAMITDPDNLFGVKGIYSHPWNEGYEWEREAQHWYFDSAKTALGYTAGIRIQGGNSVGMDKKSFRLHFRDQYGLKRLEYPLFSHASLQSFKQIVLKSGYDDDLSVSGTLVRDPLSMDLWRLSGNLASASEWAVLMLNDNYWGIYNIRESVDKDFIESHLKTADFDMIRYQKNGPELKHGSLSDWAALTNFINKTDFSTEAAYDSVCTMIDIDNFLNLLAFVHCSQYRSWTWGASAYKPVSRYAKWKWTIWDTDRAYLEPLWNGFDEYSSIFAEKWANFMPKKLLENQRFRSALINRTADFLNSWFNPEFCSNQLDSLSALIAPEIEHEKQRWNVETNWDSATTVLHNFIAQRPQIVRKQILDYFSISQTHSITVNIGGKGTVKLNYLNLESFPWNGLYFNNIPISLTAIPVNGYRFNGWSNGVGTNFIDDFKLISDTSITAYFIDSAASKPDVRINEIMYHDSQDLPSGEWIELYNAGEPVSLAGWWITDDKTLKKFFMPEHTFMNESSYMVLAENLLAFHNINNASDNLVFGSFGDGEFGFKLSNSGECIYLFQSDSSLIDSVCYADSGLWPILADGYGPSLQLKTPFADNDNPENWDCSSEIPFTPGSENRFTPASINTSNDYVMSMYPNPANENVSVSIYGSVADTICVSIITMQGKHVFKQNFTVRNKNTFTIPTAILPVGVYCILLQTSSNIFANKLLIQR